MNDYHVGDIIKLKWVIDEFKTVDEKIRVFFHRKADGYQMNFLVNGFTNLVDDPKDEYFIGDEVIISYVILEITDKQIRYKNKRITEISSIRKFIEIMNNN